MSKLINILVAVLSHSYPSGKSTVNAYVLDGSPEQHQAYRERVASSDDIKRAAVSEHTFEDRDGKYPELVGNPMFYSLEFEGKCVEICIPVNEKQMPRIETTERDQEIAVAKKCGDVGSSVWKSFETSNNKSRYSLKSKAPVADDKDIDIDA